jgi:hypothetical protein
LGHFERFATGNNGLPQGFEVGGVIAYAIFHRTNFNDLC